MRSKTTILVLAMVLAVGALWLRHYLSPAEVVRRKVLSTVAAFEDERLLAVMAVVSRSYSDPWGGDYEALAGNLRQLMESYEELRVDHAFGAIEARDDQVTIGLEFVVSGRSRDERESILGSRAEPCTAVVVWRKETPGWRLASTVELDIPELRDELEQRRAGR